MDKIEKIGRLDNSTSIKITKIAIKAFFLGFILLNIFGYQAVEYVAVSMFHLNMSFSNGLSLLVCLYLTSIPIYFILTSLHFLIRNIENEQVFIKENVRYLRWVSFSFFIIGFINIIFFYWWTSLILIVIAAFFLGVVIRVIEILFRKAITMKNELDYII